MAMVEKLDDRFQGVSRGTEVNIPKGVHCYIGILVGCGLCALCFLVVEVIVRRGGVLRRTRKIKELQSGV